MTLLVNDIIDSDFEKATSLFTDDIWLAQYKFIIDHPQLVNLFKDWKSDNKDIADFDKVIKSISLIDKEQYNLEYFTLEDVDFISVEFKSNPIFPGYTFDKTFIIAVQELDDGTMKIAGIDQ